MFKTNADTGRWTPDHPLIPIAHTVQSKGVIYVKDINYNDKVNQFAKENNIKVYHRGFEIVNGRKIPSSTIKITFDTETAPLSVKRNDGTEVPVYPSLLSPLRCNKCQKHGHTANKCTGKSVCPHCAGPHSHFECRYRDVKQCANCKGPHSAAYKGCVVYLNYLENISKKNEAIKNEYNNRIQKSGLVRSDPPKVNNDPNQNIDTTDYIHKSQVTKIIKNIAPKLKDQNLDEKSIEKLVTEAIAECEQQSEQKQTEYNKNYTPPTSKQTGSAPRYHNKRLPRPHPFNRVNRYARPQTTTGRRLPRWVPHHPPPPPQWYAGYCPY
ncbi:uncharacterized protein LOC128558250 [Mercenaria mercenaria]|uniref:uncharacterized protein LOC128558250 n=1 Tax=Mercenaria mercenaria TaxID=6596 RepID=UPI00234F29DB|nr:uncharacterized protein LOC128558250 [Mercenaria mercenaria]